MTEELLQVRLLIEQLRAKVPGGTGRYTRELAAALVQTAPEDGQLCGVVARGSAATFAGPEVPGLANVEAVGTAAPALARLWERGLGPAVRGGGVVHAPTLLVPPRRRGQALVVTIHDVVPWTHPETLTRRGVAFHQRMGRRAAREADLILTPTAIVAAQVASVLDPQGRISVLTPGTTRWPAPDELVRAAASRRLPKSRFVLFVGTAEPRKGLDVLVRAISLVARFDLDLVVVGPSGWGDVKVRDLADDAGIAHRLHVLGQVSDAELSAVYERAAVLAMPSRAEGFGLPVLEAMSKGVPVVTSDDPALVEVADGSCLVVPIGDPDALAEALTRAVEDTDLRRLLAEKGLRRAADFDWMVTASRLWELYRSVSGGKP